MHVVFEWGSCQTFYEIQRINDENYIEVAGDEVGAYNSAKRVNPIIYVLVTNKYCTYYELKYKYSVDEMLDLYEMCMVNLFNKSISMKEKV